jgi:glycosyltransferase involved in cell wall biosynthesis
MSSVLIATHVAFWQRQKGNEQRIAELVGFLARHCDVTVFYIGQETPPRSPDVTTFVTANPHRGPGAMLWALYYRLPTRLQQRIIRAINSLGLQQRLGAFRNGRVLAQFAATYRSRPYDAVLIEYIWHAYLAEAVDRSRTTIYLDIHDIIHRRVSDYARFGRVPDRTVTREEEIGEYRRCDYLIAIQRSEQDSLRQLLPEARTLLAMHPVPAEPSLYAARLRATDAAPRLTVLYFASFGDVNLDAIEWFVREVWTAELAERFEVRIHGAICDSLRIDAPGVSVCGRVTSATDAYRGIDIAINPVRFGSGLKIKTVEALAHGVPLVATTVGAEGLEEGAGRFLVVADTAADFRRELLRLTDPALRQRISEHALDYAARRLTPEACFGPLLAVIQQPRTAASPP